MDIREEDLCIPSISWIPIGSPSRACPIVTRALFHRIRPLAATVRTLKPAGYSIAGSRRGNSRSEGVYRDAEFRLRWPHGDAARPGARLIVQETEMYEIRCMPQGTGSDTASFPVGEPSNGQRSISPGASTAPAASTLARAAVCATLHPPLSRRRAAAIYAVRASGRDQPRHAGSYPTKISWLLCWPPHQRHSMPGAHRTAELRTSGLRRDALHKGCCFKPKPLPVAFRARRRGSGRGRRRATQRGGCGMSSAGA
jgi:hypothetical protein